MVGKKDGSQRLIVDGREASAMCHRPPKICLGSAAAIGEFDLSTESLRASFGDAAGDVQVHGASADLKQGFYQLNWEAGASLFGFDFPMPLSAFDTDQVYDESLGHYVAMSADTLVFACFKGLPMGWSWSMHFCNSITEDCLRTGISQA